RGWLRKSGLLVPAIVFLVCIDWSANGTQRKRRQQLPALVWPLPRIDRFFVLGTSLRPNESGIARPRCSSACVQGTCHFQAISPVKKSKIRLKSYAVCACAQRSWNWFWALNNCELG